MKRLLCLLGVSLCLLASHAPAATPLDRIAAIVNDTVITQSDLSEQKARIERNLQKNNIPLPPTSELTSQVLSQMISRELLLQRAQKTGIRVSDGEINKAIANIAKEHAQPTKELYASVATEGLTRAQFRAQIKEELLIHKLEQRDIASTIRISPEEIDEYLRSSAGQALNTTEYHLEDILIALPSAPTPAHIADAKAEASTLIAELHAGKEFTTLAASHSQGEQAFTGGDLGWHALIDLPPVFAAVVPTLAVGQVAGPLEAPNGFHIIKLLGTREPDKNTPVLSASDLRDRVQHELFEQKLQEKIQSTIAEMRASAYIQIIST